MTGRPREPASLIAGTGAFRILLWTSGDSDTLGPDNGGDSGLAYSEGFVSASQLLGPFTLCASTGLSPHPGSLNPALRATIPDRSLSHSIVDSIPHFIWEVKTGGYEDVEKDFGSLAGSLFQHPWDTVPHSHHS